MPRLPNRNPFCAPSKFTDNDEEDMKSKCINAVPIGVPIIAHDTLPVLMVKTNEENRREWVEVSYNPSQLAVIVFEEFSQRTERKITSNKQSAAAIFGQVAGSIGLLVTAGRLLKMSLRSKRRESEKSSTGSGGDVEMQTNPLTDKADEGTGKSE
eukprot:gb/GECG01012737.1/.p1 GENE.gb/GECG01012737.1/~~gb/GECG01012737.1/.p1  ORF type:complete len:155 (+),score=20.84 gb/GECG01012737.1/:1-465(+)